MAENVNIGKAVLNPTALTAGNTARLLGLDEQVVRDHIKQGAPTGPEGLLNMVHYAAWLNRRLKERDGD